MIATDIFAALWKRKNIIALFVAVALLVCHGCLFVGQTHTATVYIKFVEEDAVDGVATNGTELDPYEISEPFVVSKALNQLGMADRNASAIAQRIKVTPVISSAEQEKYASWIDQFSNYENTEEEKATPIYYRIDFKSKEGVEFAQSFVNALVQQYRSYYTERYSGFSEVALVPETVVMNSDYFYSVELLHAQINDNISRLNNIVTTDIDYRSPETGYSLTDLVDAYGLLIETGIAPVTQYILDTGVSKDLPTLVAGLQQSSDTAQRDSDENAEKAKTQEQMMLLYAEKNKEYVSTVISPDDYDTQVRGDVERDKAYIRDFTTYDQLMLDYVEYAVKSGDLLIDKAYINEYLTKFGNDASTGSAPLEEIADIYEQYVLLTNITKQTLEGYNAFKSGRVILQVCGIRTTETMPELLYYAVSGILALCVGCGLIVIYEIKKSRESHETTQETPFDRVL